MKEVRATDSLVDKRQRQIGDVNGDNIRGTLTSLGLAPFTRRLGMSIGDFTDLTLRAVMDALNPALKPYFPM